MGLNSILCVFITLVFYGLEFTTSGTEEAKGTLKEVRCNYVDTANFKIFLQSMIF